MKTILWKELRENFKWAILALLCLTLAEIYVLSTQRKNPGDIYNGFTLCSSAFLLVTSFGCSAIGGALGVAQILPELRRDRWAALLHRPVSRSVIFFGKAVAGMLLYFLAVTPPLLASAAYVAMPGQFAAPLVPGMMIPGLSDLFLGPVFYFAALLLSLHRGRWWGSRGVLGLAVLPVFLLQLNTVFPFQVLLNTGWPFLLLLSSSLLFLLAARGVMLSNGNAKNQPRTGRISLVLLMLTGAWAILFLLCLGLRQLPKKNASRSSISNCFKITTTGQVLILAQNGNGSAQVLTDLNGKVVTDERYVGNNSYQNLCQFEPLAWNGERRFEVIDLYLSGRPRDIRNYATPAVQNSYNSKERWYLLTRQNYFVGYDKLSRRCVGICDREGFKPAGAEAKPFPMKLRCPTWNVEQPYLYWSGPQFYTFDFSDRKMTPVFNAGNGTIYGAVNSNMAGGSADLIAVALQKEVRLFDLRGAPFLIIPFRHGMTATALISIAFAPALDAIYLQYRPSSSKSFSPGDEIPPIFLDKSDLRGNFLHSDSHPSLLPDSPPPPGWTDYFSTYTSSFVAGLVGTIYRKVFPPNKPGSMEIHLLPFFKIVDLALLFGIAILLGTLTLFWARRVGFSGKRSRRWALFVFCLGLPGLLVFRLAADWPTRVCCPNCGNKRPTETDECPSCRQGWPLPERNGTEIFDLAD